MDMSEENTKSFKINMYATLVGVLFALAITSLVSSVIDVNNNVNALANLEFFAGFIIMAFLFMWYFKNKVRKL